MDLLEAECQYQTGRKRDGKQKIKGSSGSVANCSCAVKVGADEKREKREAAMTKGMMKWEGLVGSRPFRVCTLEVAFSLMTFCLAWPLPAFTFHCVHL